MKINLYSALCKSLLLFLLSTFMVGSAQAQDVVYSEFFTNGATYCPSSPQHDNWGIFRAQLDTVTKKFRKVTVRGSNDPVGITCTDPTATRQIAAALRSGTTLSLICDGKTWVVGTGCHVTGGCTNINDAIELVVDFNLTCQCANPGYILRPIIGNSNWGGINGATCGGNNQTMEVIFSNPVGNNAAPGGVTAPVTSCGSVNDSLSVTIQNAGINKIANIPVTCKVNGTLGGTPYSNTFSTTIGVAPDSLNPFTSRAFKFTTLNTSNGADLDITVYTAMASDTTRGDDTLRFKYKNVGTPTGNATASNVTRCGTGAVTLNATVPSGHSAYWYNSSNKLIGVGASVPSSVVPGGTRDSFYVASAKVSTPTPLGTAFTGTSNAGSGFEGGIMFDMIAAKSLVLEGVDVHLNGTGTKKVTVYVKSGTYKGSETNKVAWTLVGSVDVTAAGFGVPVKVNLPPFELNPGTYGIYIYSSDGLLWTKSSFGTGVSNFDLSIQGGTTLRDAFATIIGQTDRFDGMVNYRQSCVSATKAKVIVTANPLAVGSDLAKGTLFKGTYDGGSISQPDIVASPDSISYEMPAPTGFTNSNYGSGSAWYVSSFGVKTINGVALPTTSYKLEAPAGGKNARIIFFPPSNFTDSTVEVNAFIRRNDNGCDTFLRRVIFVAPRPVSQYSNNVICFGDVTEFTNTTSITSGTIDYLWKFGDGTTSTLTEPAKTYGAAGNYTVVLIATSNYGYKDSSVKTVVVKEIPNPNFVITNACEGTALKFDDNSSLPPGTPTYTWNFGDGNTAVGKNVTHLYAMPNIYLAKLTIDVAGCANSASKYATQAPRSVPDFSFTAAQCDNLNIGFTNGSTPPAFGSVGYTWNFDDGTSASAYSTTHTFTSFKTYNVKLIGNTDLGCADSITKSVSLLESPKPVFTSAGAICSNQSVTITNSTNVPTGATNAYTWDFGDGNSSTDANPTHIFVAPGVYDITLDAFSSNGCTGKTTSTITVNEKPSAEFTGNNVCMGEETQFVNGSTISSGTLSYSWDLDNGSAPVTVTNPTITYATAKTYNVTLVASTTAGCTDTSVKAIKVSPIPAVDIVPASNNTGDGTIKFATTSTGAGYSYLWTFGDGGTSNLQNPSYKYGFPGNWPVRLVIRTADGCINTTTTTIFVNPLSVSEAASAKGLQVYPNPTSGKLIADFSNYTGDEVVSINITDVLGRVVLNSSLPSANAVEMNLETYPAGIYYLNVETTSNTLTIKVLVSK